MIRKSLFSIVALLATASYASAVGFDGVIFFLDNAPTAVAGGGTGSNLSGANTWHLWALDNNQTNESNGLYAYSAQMNIPGLGTAGQGAVIRHRSPNGIMEDDNGDTWAVGFNFQRSAGNNNTSTTTTGNPIQSLQDVNEETSKLTYGIGKAQATFVTQHVAQGNNAVGATAVSPNATNNTGATQWGGPYGAGAPAPYNGRNWVFIAEGGDSPDTGTMASIDGANQFTFGQVFNMDGSIRARGTVENGGLCIINDVDSSGCLAAAGDPVDITDLLIDNVNASDPGSVAGNLTASGTTPITWSSLGLPTFTPSHGGSNAAAQAAALNATLTPNGTGSEAAFAWNTVGAPRGSYVWNVSADNEFGDPALGTITVNITAVPEPATFALMGLALVGLVGIRRRG